MVGGPAAGIPKPEELLNDWRVFIQSRHQGARHLEPGTQVLYQVAIIIISIYSKIIVIIKILYVKLSLCSIQL